MLRPAKRRIPPGLLAAARVLVTLGMLALVVVMGLRAGRSVPLASVHWSAVAVALVVAVIWWVALGLGWGSLIAGSHGLPAVWTWCRTQVFRYLPGGFWTPVARAVTVRGGWWNRIATVGVENVTVLCIALALGGLLLATHDPRWAALLPAAVVPTTLAAVARGRLVPARYVRHASVTYAAGFVGFATSATLVQLSISGWHDPLRLLEVAGASCIAWAVGLVAVFAPSGVGVRELAYVVLLRGIYPAAQVEAAAVISRLVTVLAELAVLATLAVLVHRRELAAQAAGRPRPAR